MKFTVSEHWCHLDNKVLQNILPLTRIFVFEGSLQKNVCILADLWLVECFPPKYWYWHQPLILYSPKDIDSAESYRAMFQNAINFNIWCPNCIQIDFKKSGLWKTTTTTTKKTPHETQIQATFGWWFEMQFQLDFYRCTSVWTPLPLKQDLECLPKCDTRWQCQIQSLGNLLSHSYAPPSLTLWDATVNVCAKTLPAVWIKRQSTEG